VTAGELTHSVRLAPAAGRRPALQRLRRRRRRIDPASSERTRRRLQKFEGTSPWMSRCCNPSIMFLVRYALC